MWILCFCLSIVFCITARILKFRKSDRASWATACSLSFVAITLLLQYRLVLDWVNHEDWTALLDVVPTTFTRLSGYVIFMISANLFVIIGGKKK